MQASAKRIHSQFAECSLSYAKIIKFFPILKELERIRMFYAFFLFLTIEYLVLYLKKMSV